MGLCIADFGTSSRVEERGGKIYGYEFKWNPKKVKSAPAAWRKMYPDAEYITIHPDNYLDFIT